MSDYFFIVGAQRSGTTYLYRLLVEHPEIEMAKPIKPEPKFFLIDTLFKRGLDYYEKAFFGGKCTARVRGEKSTSYIEVERAASRIGRCFPDARIIFILRDPIERAISNYWFSVKNGLENMPMEEAFLREDERWLDYDPTQTSVSPYAYLRRGRYLDYICMYERYFPRSSILVVIFERLVGKIREVQRIYDFLGVTSNFTPDALDKVVNKGEKSDCKLSHKMERYLVNYFAEPSARLAEHLEINLDVWKHKI